MWNGLREIMVVYEYVWGCEWIAFWDFKLNPFTMGGECIVIKGYC